MTPACASLRRARPLLGTFVEVSAAGPSRPALDRAVDAAFEAVAQVHRLMSPHEPASDVARVNREAGARAVVVHPWTHAVLRLALELHRASAAFDVTAGTSGPEEDAVELLAGRRVRLARPGLRVDLGGIAKGFAVDRAVERLRRHGVSRGVVNAGGDLAVFGPEPETVHVRDPRAPGRVLAVVELRDEALASTGGRYNPFESCEAGPSEVIDPGRRVPASAARGATVRAATCMLADALTKIVMVHGEASAALLARYRACAMTVADDGEVRLSPGWPEAPRAA